MIPRDFDPSSLSTRRIIRTWWPLAASWVLMGAELPLLSAVMARLPNPVVSLAAFGGVVWPLALIIESPIIMLLAASTTLSKDWSSYVTIRRFMVIAGAALTALHLLVVFTPLYYVVVNGILGVPPQIVEPARVGLAIMVPWSWAIAYRRFNQGVLIRFGHSHAVGIGTGVRLIADLLVIGVASAIGTIPGIAVATGALIFGVISEAVYAALRVRPVLQDQLAQAEPVDPPLNYRSFFAFYVPLVFTALLSLLAQPIGSAALSRMPEALASLAAWPIVSGLVFMARGLGTAYNEVVVALLDELGSGRRLQAFAGGLAALTTALMLAVMVTPLANFWLARVSALSAELVALSYICLWLALPLPALTVGQSWFQGVILFSRRTRGISESVAIYLAVLAGILMAGVVWSRTTGLYVGIAAMVIGGAAQVAWLWWRARPALASIRARDATTGTEVELSALPVSRKAT